MTERRGFSLIELLMTMVVAGIVALAGWRILSRATSGASSRHAGIAREAALRTSALFLAHELRGLGSRNDTTDLLAFAPESLTYRAARSAGVVCGFGAGGILVERARFFGYRLPQAGRDSIALFEPGTDRWRAGPIATVAQGTCAGLPALFLGGPLDSAPLGTPVITWEVMQVRLYRSTDWQLGARSLSAGETTQPVAGPLAPGGLQFTGRDSLGGPASLPQVIAALGVALRAPLERPERSAAGEGLRQAPDDSLETFVTFRNRPAGWP